MLRYLLLLIYFIGLPSLIFAQAITTIPRDILSVNVEKAHLGKALFFDKVLSKDHKISCANCHQYEHAGADNLKYSFYLPNKTNPINTPTLYNARYNFVQFYDGRAPNLEVAVTMMIEDSKAMRQNITHLAKMLNNTHYKSLFEAIYHDSIKPKHISNAIAEYIKTLTTPNAAFDQYLRGNTTALNTSQKRGYTLFQSKGCIICHNGVNLGGNLFAKFGEIEPATNPHLGRFIVTKDPHDKYFFKVPTLRNISKTAPYMHDGRFYSLRDVVIFMLEYQLDKTGDRQDIDDIVNFLHTLDGEVPKNVQ